MKQIITGICITILMTVSSAFQESYAQPKAVDLGLSVKWADRNIGASTPEGNGDYYAWGETSTKSDYSWNTYKYCTDTSGDHFNKYVYSLKSEYWSGSGSPDNKTRLELSDDAARAKLGGKWRTPTMAEWEELKEKCTWSWTGSGYRVTGPNGRSIFLPAAGVRDGSSSSNVGSDGYYCTTGLLPSRTTRAARGRWPSIRGTTSWTASASGTTATQSVPSWINGLSALCRLDRELCFLPRSVSQGGQK